MIILIPFSLPIFIYLWVKRYRPCHKVNPANDLTKDIQWLWMLNSNSYESIFDTGKENKLRLYIFCYIVPFIISFLNLLPWLIKPDPNFSYHRNDTCWVNIDRKDDDGSISDQSWTYLIGFYLVLVVMLFANIAILSYGLRINLKVTLVMHAIIKTVWISKNIEIIENWYTDDFCFSKRY